MKKAIIYITMIVCASLQTAAWRCPDCDRVFTDGNANGDRDVNTTDVVYIYNQIIGDNSEPEVFSSINLSYRGKFLSMLFVEGGTFNMGNPDAGDRYWEEPVHLVTLANYYIAQTEMYNDFYKAIMGDAYIMPANKEKYPVSNVSYDEIQKFLDKANAALASQLGGYELRLPTEAEWEYAARGGKKSKGYKYSGYRNLGDVGWYIENSNNDTHPYAQKVSNELRLSDMSGNVGEICSDYMDLSYYGNSPAVNPQGPKNGTTHVMRGGSSYDDADKCTVYARKAHKDFAYPDQGFRLALTAKDKRFNECPTCGHRFLKGDTNSDGQLNSADVVFVYNAIINGGERGDDTDDNSSYTPKDQTFTVDGVSFNVKAVEGGTYMMGQEEESIYLPTHRVTVSSFAMGETEVTQELFEAVTGSNPATAIWLDPLLFVEPQKPVIEVSKKDAEDFCNKLTAALKSQLGGAKFRLPTEAEWEYAARGGNKSRGYTYSGSNYIKDVAWYAGNSEDEYWTGSSLKKAKMPHAVKTKRPNELGIYDMSGNIGEWCRDYYDENYYSKSPSDNPQNTTVSDKGWVVRGGDWISSEVSAPVYGRDYSDSSNQYIGFRVVLR